VFEQTCEAKDKTVKLSPFSLEQSLGLAALIVWRNRRSELYKDIFVRHLNDDNKNVLWFRVGVQSGSLSDSGEGTPVNSSPTNSAIQKDEEVWC
jgi:hypothetical protein